MASSPLTLRRSTAMAWRSLRSMRTALVLLLLVALAAVAGSLVPQVGVADLRIAATFRDHPLRARIFEQLGLFDVYGSWWFTLLYVLLLVSLGACLLPRTRAFVRNLRTRPAPTRELEGLRHYAELTVAAGPDRAIAGARRVLRRRLFRVSGPNGRPALAADKGLARELGSLLFHWSFFLLLIGIVWGKGTGFSGQAVIVEGQAWVEAHANYDGQVREGRFFGEDHSGARILVRAFEVAYRPTGQPEDFVTRATISQADGSGSRDVEIRVNEPAEIDGVRLYQFGYGWAPVVYARSGGELVASDPMVCAQEAPPEGLSPLQMPWNCVLKLPSLRPQVGVRFQLWPDSRGLFALLETGTAMPMFGEYAPVMSYTVFEGDLRSELVQRAGILDTSAMRETGSGVLGAGETIDVADGLELTFDDLRRYTVLQVARDRGRWIVFAAAILVLVGLLPALYTSRRKLWVTAETNGGGTVLKVGGFALQRRQQFEEEFFKLVTRLERASRERERVDT
jgi:cytochrome c biogenesis protein